MGFALVISPIYIAEISPPKSRGFLTSLPEICISIGMMLGIVSSRSFDWTVVSGISAVPSLALAIGFLKMSESPRWLVMQGSLEEAIRKLYYSFRTQKRKLNFVFEISWLLLPRPKKLQ
ncbi:uncharacterized protein Pyn_20272 [Prunus yedoensis var. nudiflora]|uniref:Major facilitator superfamily (MFS) profile domain-containing protein n=1 Tax=Prunus yedoensis var. nudiflora TaxID=2094558 RepID=A0A314YDI4_PRUYE|nr:uncharacterized protein Pyn_20272 [Prunus yedoensis var. nudiflora]